LPVFKTGALGRYASPPWANLPPGVPVTKKYMIIYQNIRPPR